MSSHANRDKSSSCDIYVTWVDVRCWFYAIYNFWGWICQRVCYLTIASLLFGTNCVIVTTEYWSSHQVLHWWICRQNKNLEIQRITEWLIRKCSMKKMRRKPDFLMKQNAPQARLIKPNAPQARFFDWILMGSLSSWYGIQFIFNKLLLRICFI